MSKCGNDYGLVENVRINLWNRQLDYSFRFFFLQIEIFSERLLSNEFIFFCFINSNNDPTCPGCTCKCSELDSIIGLFLSSTIN